MVAQSILKLDITKSRVLVIDPSAMHMAYVVAEVDLDTKTSKPIRSGMIWCKSGWSKGQRFSFVDYAIRTLIKEESISDVYTEGFFVNPKMMFGSGVIPTINGLIEMNCYRSGINYKQEIPPPTWRAALGLKAIKDSKGKRDWKTPTKDIVESKLVKLPLTLTHNVTGKQKKTPFDISDVLAMYMAICKDNNLTINLPNVDIFSNPLTVKE